MAVDLDSVGKVLDQLVAHGVAWFERSGDEFTEFSLKRDGSRVTQIDRRIEREWRDILAEAFPEHAILGEEFGSETHGDSEDRPFCWILDPIDGTDDFTRGIPLFGYIIALTYQGKPVAAATGHPGLRIGSRTILGRGTYVNGERVRLDRGRPGSDTAIAIPSIEDFMRHSDRSSVLVDLAMRFPNYRVYRNVYAHTCVLRESLDAAIEFDVAPWDIVATQVMVEEAGGSFRLFRQVVDDDGVCKSGAVFGRRLIVAEICRTLAGHGYHCE